MRALNALFIVVAASTRAGVTRYTVRRYRLSGRTACFEINYPGAKQTV